MAFNGAGVFQRIYNWVTDAANSINITDTRMDAEMDGFATGLSTCITKDGQTTITANLPMATFRHTGVGNATARTDYAAAGQVQDSSFTWCGTAGGTKNALTLTPTPAITAYATGQEFVFKAGATSSDDAVTISISGLTTKAAQLNDTACSASVYIEANKYYRAIYDGTAIQLTRLSTFISPFAQTLIDDASAADARTTIGLEKGVLAGNVLQADQAETTVASAASVALASTTQNNITGTTAVGTFTGTAGLTHHCKATGALPLTHSAGLNILQTGASVTLDAGATFDVYMLTSNTCEVRNIQLASGRALIGGATKTLSFTRDTAAAAGNVAYTGFGGTPISITIRSSVQNTVMWSIGEDNGVEAVSTIGKYDGTVTYGPSDSVFIYAGATAYQSARVLSFAADTVTLAWAKTGEPTVVAALHITARF